MGPPPDPRGHIPFTPYSGFIPGTQVFTHYTSARQRYAPHDVGSDKQHQNLKSFLGESESITNYSLLDD